MPTIKDVAKAAGVAPSTVSLVLNKKAGPIRQETQDHVRRVAEQMGYRPNAAARGLRRARLDTIGVSLHAMGGLAISNPYANQVLQGVVQAAHNAQYNVTHVHQPWSAESGSLEGFRSDLVDGMVVVAPDERMIADLSRHELPVVAVSAPAHLCGVPTVDVDNVRGTRLVMHHLIGLGHRRIGILVRRDPRPDSQVRRDTFIAEMAAAGISVPAEYIQHEDEFDLTQYGVLGLAPMDSRIPFEFYGAARKLLTLPNRPTAVFGCDDRVARDILLAASDLGISVPEELSVVGFDDVPDAHRLDPPLTTVRQPLVEMGGAATRLLLAILAGEKVEPETQWFQPELIVRKSTGPAPA